MCDSVDVFLRARRTPITVQQLEQEFPLPSEIPGNFLRVLSSDERFELRGLESTSPTVQMRTTPPKAPATPAKTQVVCPTPSHGYLPGLMVKSLV